MFGYRFINSELIVNAFTHPSCSGVECYERLELLGDAVIGFYVAQKIYHMNDEWDEGNMTDLKGSLVSNRYFGVLLLERWHRGIAGMGNSVLRTLSDCLMCLSDSRTPVLEFVGEWEAVRQLLQSSTTNNPFTKTLLESPKFLANIYEAVVGAVFLDCGSKLAVIEEVFGPDFANFTVKQAQAEIDRVFERRKQQVKRQLMIQRAVQKEERRLKKEAEQNGEGSKDQNATVEVETTSEEAVQKDTPVLLADEANKRKDKNGAAVIGASPASPIKRKRTSAVNATVEVETTSEEAVQKDTPVLLADEANKRKDKNGAAVIGASPASPIKRKRTSAVASKEDPVALNVEKVTPKEKNGTDVVKEKPASPSKHKRNCVVAVQKALEIVSDSAVDEAKPKDEKVTGAVEKTAFPSKHRRNSTDLSGHL